MFKDVKPVVLPQFHYGVVNVYELIDSAKEFQNRRNDPDFDSDNENGNEHDDNSASTDDKDKASENDAKVSVDRAQEGSKPKSQNLAAVLI